MRRPIVVAGALALTLSAPAAARAEPKVPDAEFTKGVRPIAAGSAVRGIDLSKSVVSLEEEQNDGGQITVRISADVLFDFNRATLTDAARHRIADLVPRLRDAKGTIRVSGHSDSIGDEGYNLTLSKSRAEAVRAELRDRLKGAAAQIEAKGYGETKPVAPNESGGKDNPEGRAKNRRVEITYQKE